MGEDAPADLLLVNGRVLTLDPAQPSAKAVAIRGSRILAIGSRADLEPLRGPQTQVLDTAGCLVAPGFHDAHLHLLSWARRYARMDLSQCRSVADVRAVLAIRNRGLPPGAWLRAVNYDEIALAERRQLDRTDLDAAVSDRPVRVQHRTQHLDVLNSAALRALRLDRSDDSRVERHLATRQPTGRIYHGADLLRERDHPSEGELAADVARACATLLRRGVTSVQDASLTNGPEEWLLFQRLAMRGALRVRTFFMPGASRWREAVSIPSTTDLVQLGPVKLAAYEGVTDPATLSAEVRAVHAAGRRVAIHAIGEAEVVLALAAINGSARPPGGARDRIEHAAVLPDDLIPDLLDARVAVVGQPSLLYTRGDVYRADFPPEQHAWLHRAGTLVRSGILYAVGSDAPVSEPDPMLAFYAMQTRRTISGTVFGLVESLSIDEGLAAMTLAPARALGAPLGQLSPGAPADVVLLDPADLWPASAPSPWTTRATIAAGRLVWNRGEAASTASPPVTR